MRIYDLLGIGFGPSNVALAITLQEHQQNGHKMDAIFVERQQQFAWHPDMMLPHAHMQISFMKDLVTLRNPKSPFTFINYLQENDRLQDFINLKTFYPSRHEFNDYLSWSAAKFADQVAYGEEVINVTPVLNDTQVDYLKVTSKCADGRLIERFARNLVLGIGGKGHVPAMFAPYKDDPRFLHSSRYLTDIKNNDKAERIAIIGAGQSAAEIFVELNDHANKPAVDLVMRARSIKPSDDSPFVNEIFNADFTDFVYERPNEERKALLDEFWHTNYAAPDLELIQKIFSIFYEQKVAKQDHHNFLRRHEVTEVDTSGSDIRLTLKNFNTKQSYDKHYDAVVLATGYERDVHKRILAPLAPYLGDYEVNRNYRVNAAANFQPKIFLQGACEASHGLSDTLLSIVAVRSQEILDDLNTPAPKPAAAKVKASKAKTINTEEQIAEPA